MKQKILKNTVCDNCNTMLTNWDYRYQGKHYCRKCYDSLFRFKICVRCNKRRKIYISQKPPICKFCQVKDKSCIRCGKTDYTNGKITQYGPVCNACSRYYTQYDKCSVCKKDDNPTSNRTLHDGSKKFLCEKCYNKTLPICIECGYRRKAFSFRLDKKPLCKICSIEHTRKCIKCGIDFPAGFGNICSDCHYNNAITKKSMFIAKTLSHYCAQYFIGFSNWLKSRRGLLFTSTNLQNYQKYFFQIDKLAIQMGRIPTYEELLATFPHATQNKNTLIHLYFEEIGVIKINEIIKDKYANLNLIEKYLTVFNKDDRRHTLIQSYYKKLLEKCKAGKITFRSVRLALTPAIKLLQYSSHFKEDIPNMNILEGYLWIYPGQRSALTEFTNFLSKYFAYKLKISSIPYAKLEKAHESRELLLQRIIKMFQGSSYRQEYYQYFLKTLIGYLHNIYIPDYAYVDLGNIKKNLQGNNYLRLCGENFYLPDMRILEIPYNQDYHKNNF